MFGDKLKLEQSGLKCASNMKTRSERGQIKVCIKPQLHVFRLVSRLACFFNFRFCDDLSNRHQPHSLPGHEPNLDSGTNPSSNNDFISRLYAN